jgi:hypothetical protein
MLRSGEEAGMPIYLVGYDLNHGTESEYADLIGAIKEFGDWWHCLDSTWLVDHAGPASAIYATLAPHLENPDDEEAGDRLLVARMGRGAAWTGSFSDDCEEWLEENLRPASS